MAPWAKRAFVGMLAVTVLLAITAWPEGAWIRSVVAQVQSQLNAGATNVTINRPAGLTIVTSLVLLLEIAIFVVLLNWQYSAAKTARMLDLPATHSPGLGVGSWFIPVVNFWFPYQALRDCLSVGHPERRVVGRMWICYLGAVVTGGVALGLSYARTPIAIGVAEVAVAFAIGVACSTAPAWCKPSATPTASCSNPPARPARPAWPTRPVRPEPAAEPRPRRGPAGCLDRSVDQVAQLQREGDLQQAVDDQPDPHDHGQTPPG